MSERSELDKMVDSVAKKAAEELVKGFADNYYGFPDERSDITTLSTRHLGRSLTHIATVFNHVSHDEKRQLVYHLIWPHVKTELGYQLAAIGDKRV
jgi:hypothetical protein